MNEHLEDWQRGEGSTLTPTKSLVEHNLWLKKLHQEVKDKIYDRNKVEENDEPRGFVKD